MDTTPVYTAPAQGDFRARLHEVIDQIQDEAVLQAALLLLQAQAVLVAEPALSPAWQAELDRRLAEHDSSKNIPAVEFLNQLLRESA